MLADDRHNSGSYGDVRAPDAAKRALEVDCAGGHTNLIFIRAAWSGENDACQSASRRSCAQCRLEEPS